MSKHTPGPWALTGRTIIGADMKRVASLWHAPDGSLTRLVAEADANARLIATAPDLLSALGDMLSRINAGGGSASWTAEERDALEALCTKARGEG